MVEARKPGRARVDQARTRRQLLPETTELRRPKGESVACAATAYSRKVRLTRLHIVDRN